MSLDYFYFSRLGKFRRSEDIFGKEQMKFPLQGVSAKLKVDENADLSSHDNLIFESLCPLTNSPAIFNISKVNETKQQFVKVILS